MPEESQRFPSQSASRIFARFNIRNFIWQNRRVNIVSARTRVKVIHTCCWNSLLCMESQLLDHPVIVRPFNVCIPNFPVSRHLPTQDVLRRWHNRSRIPRLRWLLIQKFLWSKILGYATYWAISLVRPVSSAVRESVFFFFERGVTLNSRCSSRVPCWLWDCLIN